LKVSFENVVSAPAAYFSAEETLPTLALLDVPNVVNATIQTMATSATIKVYSTMLWPERLLKFFRNRSMTIFMLVTYSQAWAAQSDWQPILC